MSPLFSNPAFVLSRGIVALVILIGFVPVVWPIGATYEGRVLPVVENVEVEFIRIIDVDGLPTAVVNARFDKIRACEFEGVVWFRADRRRAPVIFDDDRGLAPATRPVEDGQNAGPWRIIGIGSEEELAGSIAMVQSRCHPLWKTFTPFFP